MTTFTASLQFSDNVKSVHTGVLHTGCAASISATGTASSILLLCRLPDGATILDWWAYIDDAGDNQVYQIGTSATPSGIAAAFSLSASASASVPNVHPQGVRAPMGNLLPARISLSDDAEPANVWVQMKFGTAISASLALVFNLFYTMDGTNGFTTIR